MNNEGPNQKCPVGTNRLTDKYKGDKGTFFDVCVTNKEEINNCDYYEWDGASCRMCITGYTPSRVAVLRGDGRIKSNAVCTHASSVYNEYCSIFKHCTTSACEFVEGEGADATKYHYCERCKPGYEWPRQDNVVRKGLCMKEINAAFWDPKLEKFTFMFPGFGKISGPQAFVFSLLGTVTVLSARAWYLNHRYKMQGTDTEFVLETITQK